MTGNTTTELAAVQAAAIADKPLSIKDTVLAQFKEAEQTINGLVEKYRDVAYDVTTPKGMKEAIAARADLRENGRFFVTRAEARVKGEVNDLKRVMSSEVERLVAIVKPHEDAIDKQIKVEEDRKEAERQERARIEAERVAKHRQGLDKIATYPKLLDGRSVEDIEIAITKVEAITVGESWEEFAEEAKQALAKALADMREVLSRERMRLENERMAAQLKAQSEALALANTELMRQRVATTVFAFPVSEPQDKPHTDANWIGIDLASTPDQSVEIELQQPQQGLKAPSEAMADATEDRVAALGRQAVRMAEQVDLVKAFSAAEPATLKLGEICARLGLTLTAGVIEDVLGIAPAKIEKASKLYRPSDFARICDALIAHVQKAKAGELIAA